MRIDPLLYSISVERTLEMLLKAMQNQLTLEENLWMKQVTATSHATPGTAFTVTHSLGKVPQTWIAMPQANCTVWEYDRANWTSTTMQLKCSVASATIVLTVL